MIDNVGMKNTIRRVVYHSEYGEGTIIDFCTYNNHFRVEFKDKTRSFIFPSSFNNCTLIPNNKNLINNIQEDLSLAKKSAYYYLFNGKIKCGKYDSSETINEELDLSVIKELKRGVCYGTSAYDIYVSLCNNRWFNWCICKRNDFRRQTELFSQNCDDNNYSVWFVAYSTYNGSLQKDRKYANSIDFDDCCITEEWNINNGSPEEKNAIKIVFVKNRNGEYEFWGLMSSKVNDTHKPYTVKNTLISNFYNNEK